MTDTPIQRAYEELSRLTQETTELLEQYLLLKSRLNTSVERSETAANNAQSSEDDTRKLLQQVQTLKQTIDTKYTDVIRLLNNAEAVVYGGGHSVDPKAGNVPIADANGKLDEGWLPDDWSQLEAVLALAVDNVTENLQRYKAELEAQNHLAVLDDQVDSLLKRLISLTRSLEDTDHNLGVVQQDLENVALVTASQDEYYAEILRGMGQSGVFMTRQYNYGGQKAYQRPFAVNYSALGVHNHADFGGTQMILGMAEGESMIDGRYIRRRHTDYIAHMPNVVGSSFLSTVSVPTPNVPPDVLALPAEQQYLRMREYFEVAAGLRPASDVADYRNAFTLCMTYEETWDEEFDVKLGDTFTSGRHVIDASSIQELLTKAQYYNETALKNNLENQAYWHCGVKGVDKTTGTARIFIRKSRVLMMPVGSLADYPINDVVEPVDDRITRAHLNMGYSQALNSGVQRFRVKPRLGNAADYPNAPELIDELISKIPGLDGVGAIIRDRYTQYGQNIVLNEYGKSTELNAAYYHRFYSASALDASNRSSARRGYNDPTLFVAANTRKQVVPVTVGTETKRFSRMTPLELVILTPLHNWNPYNIPLAPYSDGLGGTQANPLNGYAEALGYYRTPGDLFVNTNTNAGDPADTVRPGVWVRCGDGVARKHVASGVYIMLPTMPNVGAFRCRYPIPYLFHEGSYAHAYSEALLRDQDAWAALTINAVAESLQQEKRLLDIEKVIGA